MNINIHYAKLILIFTFIVPSLSMAQTNLFNRISNNVAGSPLPTVNASYEVNINFRGLKYFPDSLQMNLPDGTSINIQKQIFDPRKGYVYRVDEDPVGTPDFWVDPSVRNEEYSYLWAGSNDDYDVVITVNKGQLVATFSGNTKRYVIQKNTVGGYMLTDVRVAGLPTHQNDTVLPSSNRPTNNTPDLTSVSNIKSFDTKPKNSHQNRGTDVYENTILDVLIVYTEQARIESGGNPNDPDDTIHIETNIIQVVDNTNLALINSEIKTRITRFHVAKLNGFTHQGSAILTINALRTNQSLKNLRTNVGADMVSLIIEDALPQSAFNHCGIAYSQTFPNPDWTVGASFNDWAYSIVQHQCLIHDNTFGHELGHLMGTQHVKDPAEHENGQATIDAIVNNGYGYAFGYKSPIGISPTFKTLMSTEQFTEFRRLYFSNPDKFVNNQFIGHVIDADNSRVIDELSPAMALYKSRPDFIFSNGFE